MGTFEIIIKAIATVLMPLLSYRYETSDIGGVDAAGGMGASSAAAKAAESSEADFKKLQDRLERGANVRTEALERIELTRGARMRLGEPLTLRVAQPVSALKERLSVRAEGERSFIRINHADLPETNDFLVRVFLNQPKANRATSVDDPHFAGSFAFFGTAGQHAGHGEKKGKTEFLVNITATIERLAKAGMLDSNSPLTVQLVAVPGSARGFSKAESTLTISSVELIRARVLIDAQPAPS